MENINEDLVQTPDVGVPQEGEVESADVEESSANQQGPVKYLEEKPEENQEVPEEEVAASFFEQGGSEVERGMASAANSARGVNRPIAASLLAIALSQVSETDSLGLLSKDNLQLAQNILDDQEEYNARLKVAGDRNLDTLRHIEGMRRDWEDRAKKGAEVPEGVRELIDDTYQRVLSDDIEENSRVALEMEAIERVQAAIAAGNDVEATIMRDQLFGEGGADQRTMDDMIKMLAASQALEVLENDYEESGWVRGFFNGMLRLIPTLDLFSASGITQDAGLPGAEGSGILNFILAGDNLNEQRQTLWDLPVQDFVKAIGPDGEGMAAIRKNADFLLTNPTRALETGSFLLAAQEQDPTLENVFGVLDVGLLAAGATGKLGKSVTMMGSRKLASNQMSKAVLETIENGDDAAKAATGVTKDEITEALTSKAHSGLGKDASIDMGTDIAANLATARELREILPNLIASQQISSADGLRAAYEVIEKGLKEAKYGDHIKQIRHTTESLETGKTGKFTGLIGEDGATLYKIEVTLGKKDGGGYARKIDANNLLEKFGREGEVYQDPASKQWFAKAEVAVPIDGFNTSTLKTPDSMFSWFRSSARTADPELQAKGLLAGNTANRFFKSIEQALKDATSGIPRKDINELNQIILKGQNEAKYYEPEELSQLFERNTGRPASDKIQKAYSVYRTTNDLTYLVRNDALYMRKYNQGFESHRFRMAGREVDIDASVIENPTKRPLGQRMWDASKDRWLDDTIPSAEIKKMSGEGYVMLRLDRPFSLPDGRVTNYAMVKRTDLRTRPLRRMQLNYSQGGSRIYDATHYVKQALTDVDGNLLSPRSMVAGKNLNEMKEWAETMNRAIKVAKEGNLSPAAFDEIFENAKGFPTGDDFVRMIKDNDVSLDHLFEVVEDGKMPSAYFGKSDEAMKYVDVDEVDVDSYYRGTGQMYYGTKGDILKDSTGDIAKTIDPWNALNSTINEAARAYTFRGYKQNALEKFNNTYGAYLNKDGVSDSSLYELVRSPIKNSTPSEIARKIQNEQAAIARLLHFETGFEKKIRDQWRATSEWILGDAADKSIRGAIRRGMLNLEENNPVQALRSLAFDVNLGFFNPGQLFIQSSTMISASALSPKHGIRGFQMIMPMKAYATNGYKDNMLDLLAKRGVWKGSFDSVEDFKTYARTIRDSGLYEVSGHNLAMIREFGANKVFGASSKYDAVAEKGRMFFYFAEQMNRTVASRIAWGELKDKGLQPGSAKFLEQFAQLTDDYSFNMMSQSAAGFQKGLAAIPTQFWAYSVRMLDAMMGTRFTGAQKARLLFANTAMAGAAGIPGGILIKELYEQITGTPVELDDTNKWLARGGVDALAYAATGMDVNIGERIGTSDLIANIARDIFGKGEYGEKSVVEMALGATGGKLAAAAPVLGDVIYYSAAEMGGLDTEGLAEDTWIRLADEVASFRGFHRAFIAHQQGAFYSKNGALIAEGLPDAAPFFLALSFTPGEQGELSIYFDKIKQDEAVKEAASKISNWRQEAFTFPDKYEENRAKANAFMNLYPPHMRVEILKAARTPESNSMYDTIKARYEKETLYNEFYDEMVPMVEDEIGANENAN